MNILNKIIDHKKYEVEQRKRQMPLSALRESKDFERKTFSLKKTLGNGTGIIAEFKRKSPSKGVIDADASPQSVAKAYAAYGASAISVLTDTEFFGGSSEDLVQVRNTVNIPVLRKDFMIDEYQFYEAKALGADLVLLIAACLSAAQTQDFAALSHELGLEVLLEIHNEEELGHFNKDVDFVGINNRNLKNFEVDLQHSVRLKNQLPSGTLSIAESGIYSVEDFNFLRQQGFDGFLMGEFFMKEPDPGVAFENFVKNIGFKDEN